ncbi:MAG TPA: 4Fe-4S dicluster domain-containing protein [Terracidiphilus sp.]
MLGEGILKGLAETARNFAGSFVDKERLTTVEYPEERIAPAEAARVFPFLVYDGGDWEKGLRCVACQICEKECPPKCIYIEKSKDKKPDYAGKPQIYPAKFDIDISVCMSCQICVEVCPFEAIKMDNQFELATDDRFGGLLLDRKQLAKSNEYYHQIHPTEATAVDAHLAAEKLKVEAKAKADAAAKAKTAADAAAKASTAPKPSDGSAATPASAATKPVREGAESTSPAADKQTASADPSTAVVRGTSAAEDKPSRPDDKPIAQGDTPKNQDAKGKEGGN